MPGDMNLQMLYIFESKQPDILKRPDIKKDRADRGSLNEARREEAAHLQN